MPENHTDIAKYIEKKSVNFHQGRTLSFMGGCFACHVVAAFLLP
jgi:hypothetical protein